MAFLAYFSKEVVNGPINPSLLQEEAAAVFGKRFVSCDGWEGSRDTRGMGIYLGPPLDDKGEPLPNEITKEDEAAWDAVILAHDGTRRTADQEIAEAESAEKFALKDAAENWDALDAETKDYMMRLTVERAARTEG